MLSLPRLSVIAMAATKAAAHGGVLSYSWSGDWYWGWKPYNSADGQTSIQRPWATYNPITDATDSTIACNDDGTSGALQLTATAAAGTAITAYWNQIWPHDKGPMLTYLAQCPGSTCTGVDAGSLSWFKIDQSGLVSGTIGNGTWGSGLMIAQNSSWTTTIPKSVPSGNYLLRFETIALHSLPAQFYPERVMHFVVSDSYSLKLSFRCAQITITGGGSLSPTSSELVKFPGAYSNSDPGLSVDIYTNDAQTETNYVIPGPPLYAGASGSTGGSTTIATSTTTTKGTSSSSTTQGTSTTSSNSGSSTGAAQYGQCGGSGWSGPTTCVSPYTCTVLNDYYSQCL